MGKRGSIAGALLVTAFMIVLSVQCGVLSASSAATSFADRWAPVDQAIRSHTFAVQSPLE
jgi:hypothetical protein